MTATPTEHRFAPTRAPNTGGQCVPANDDAIVLILYGDEHVNLALADELELDGYEVRRGWLAGLATAVYLLLRRAVARRA